MDIGAAGSSLIFFALLIGLILLGLLVFAYAAYSFLLVLSNTAVGNDEVIWPGDPLQDWFFKGWYLAWLVAVWAVPASFIVRLLNPPRPLFAVSVVACLWLLFPVGLLSSLSAESRLLVLRPIIVLQLLKHFGITLRFYMSSGLVVLVCGVLGYAAIFGSRIRALDHGVILMPLGAAACAAGGLIYARLLGRTALLTGEGSFEEPALSEPETRPPSPTPRPKKKPRTRNPQRAYDPWAISTEEPASKTKPTSSRPSHGDDPYGPAEGTYGVLAEGAPAPGSKPPPGRGKVEQEELSPYAVSIPSEQTANKLPPPAPPRVSKFEEELAAPRLPPPLPSMPLVTGTYSFPFYAQSIGPWATLATGLFGVIGLMRLVISALPF